VREAQRSRRAGTAAGRTMASQIGRLWNLREDCCSWGYVGVWEITAAGGELRRAEARRSCCLCVPLCFCCEETQATKGGGWSGGVCVGELGLWLFRCLFTTQNDEYELRI